MKRCLSVLAVAAALAGSSSAAAAVAPPRNLTQALAQYRADMRRHYGESPQATLARVRHWQLIVARFTR